MILLQKTGKLVNMTKKFKIIVVVNFLFYSSVLAFSPEYEKQMYIGCYGNSKVYLGAEKAKSYCLCTIIN